MQPGNPDHCSTALRFQDNGPPQGCKTGTMPMGKVGGRQQGPSHTTRLC